MDKYIKQIEQLWDKRTTITHDHNTLNEAKRVVSYVISKLDEGDIRVCTKHNGQWIVHEWIKKAILLSFALSRSKVISAGTLTWYDKIRPKFDQSFEEEQFAALNSRIVPGAYIRAGAYIGQNVIVMPSFINIGAYVDDGTMVDTWATIGSCAQIGKNCHISGGVGIGGVLEPLQSKPVIIEDDCFIGARSEIAEGVIVERGAVIAMGVYIASSTKIFDSTTGEILYGRVPAFSVVVPGTLPHSKGSQASIYCAVIIKKVDESTRKKTAINELLRT